ncbi:DGQHR domain-containing protein [Leptospira levettii]|uniref:DGQHR domain-containing protein n=1 Tax=Leptospira levettii TaxID=2023178 RepID=A0ABY2MKG7_9LEPT|nr:DGQHR domain-containing protein [Leptospira levettii]PKA23189.1 hypothetical protein CH381_26955 [Leptospira sp. mixed culture ATI2-C-A1]TGL67623.1 DGQHR domain-containing protein [Leptospira levettii]
MKKINTISINQPIGTFYIGKMNGKDLSDTAYINRRDYEPNLFDSIGGVQRKDSKKRILSISEYVNDPDAIFPAPIIISVKSDEIKISKTFEISFETDKKIFEVIDGQHRLLGLRESKKAHEFEIPVAILVDITEEQKAYIFSTINSNQEKVSTSLIYDLFGVTEGRSPYKTCHFIARSFNSDRNSPFYQKLKMLGKTVYGEESLTQGTFVNKTIDLISSDPKKDTVDLKNNKGLLVDSNRPLREFFINNQDDVIYKIMLNYFQAISEVFKFEWENHDKFVIRRTTGFAGLIFALKIILPYGYEKKRLNNNFFYEYAINFKNYLENENIKLTLENFTSNYKNQNRIKDYFLKANNLSN